MLSPLEIERNELGYYVEEVRRKSLRVIKRSCPGSNVCVFMVHGGGGRAGQFKHQIKALESEVDIVALDFLGHGDSPRPNQPELYTANEATAMVESDNPLLRVTASQTNQHLEDLKALYDRHKQERNVFVAHCYGAAHVLRLLNVLSLENRLNEVVGVVILALGVNSPVSLGLVGKLPAFMLEWLRPLARSASNAALFTPTTDPALIQFENSMSDNNRMYVMKVIGTDCSKQEVWEKWLKDARHVLSGSGVATTLICGDSDGVFSLENCEKLKSFLEIPEDCFHIIKDAGHLAMLEKPVEVNRIVLKFLTDLSCLKTGTAS